MRLFSRDCAGTGKSGGTCCAAGMFGGGRLPFPSEPGKGTGLFVGAHRLRAVTGARTFPFQSRRGGAHGPGRAARGRADGAKAGAWLLGRCGEGRRWYGTGRGRMSCGVGMWARFSRDGQGALPGGCFSYHADAPAVSARLPPRRKAGDGKGGFRQRQGVCLGMFPSEPGKGTGLFVGAHRLRAETGARTFPFHSGRGGAHDPGKAARGGAGEGARQSPHVAATDARAGSTSGSRRTRTR